MQPVCSFKIFYYNLVLIKLMFEHIWQWTVIIYLEMKLNLHIPKDISMAHIWKFLRALVCKNYI